MKKTKSNITSWLKEHGDPKIKNFVEKEASILEKEHLTKKQTKDLT